MAKMTIATNVDAGLHAAVQRHAVAQRTSVSKWLEQLIIDELKRLYGNNYMPEQNPQPVSFIQKEQIPIPAALGVTVNLGRETLAALNREAAKRRLTTRVFIERLLDAIVEGTLFIAVLDDAPDEPARDPNLIGGRS